MGVRKIMSDTQFKTGDNVIVVGATFDVNGVKTIHKELCKVYLCGKYDVFVTKISGVDSYRPFRVTLESCQKINMKKLNVRSRVSEPSIGDLVAAVIAKYAKAEHHVGRLEEIIEKPGSGKMAKIRISDQIKYVDYNCLIILEE